MGRRGPSNSSPYGLACQSCFKAKCKCVARPNGEGCQRCHRLDKECYPSDSVRRRTIDKKQASSTRIADLESKLTDLISQLQSRNVLDGERPSGANSQLASTEQDQELEFQSNDGQGDDQSEDDGIAVSGRWSRSPEPSTLPEMMEPTGSVIEMECVEQFRSHMLPHFAFVHLPPHLTHGQLRRDRPFVLRSILCVMAPTATERLARTRRLKTAIAQALVGQGDQTDTEMMDLLLGILIYIIWGWDHVVNRGSLSRLMMQAMSLACEMRLDKPTPQDAQMMALFTPGFDTSSRDTECITTEIFLERQRAILGCFALSSAVSSYFGEIDALQWTSQMENGLAAISANRDCPTDAVFALQIRLQLIAQRTVQVKQQHQMEQGLSVTESAALPALMTITTLQGQLQQLQTSLPPHMSQQKIITAQIHSADLRINETTYAVNSTVPLMVSHFSMVISSTSGGSSGDLASARRLGQERSRCLWQCLCAIKGCTEALLDLSSVEFARITFLEWSQLANCVVVLNRLTTTIDDPAWNRTAARDHVDMPMLLRRIVEKLELASQVTGEHRDGDVFTQLAQKMDEFLSDMTGSIACERRAADDEHTAMNRSRQYGGVGIGASMSMSDLASISDR